MPESSFAHTAHAGATPAAIWIALQDAETWLGLGVMDSVFNAVVEDGRLASFDWTAAAAGTRHRGRSRTMDAVPGQLMVLELDSAEVAGEIAVALDAEAAGTALTVTLTARPRGFIAGMFWGKISAALGNGLVTHVDGFAARFSGA
jgi:hypothetical protein